MSNIPLNRRRIWLTGATSGIGNALLRILVERDNNMIISARNEVDLLDLRQENPNRIEILSTDIAQNGAEDQMQQGLEALTGTLDTVILNAGDCEYLDVGKFDTDMIERIFQVNTIGVARCLQACLPLLRKSANAPHIIGISSAAAITGLPRAEAYGASKAAMSSLLESLSLDLSPEGIDVSVVYPGFVDTPLTRMNDFPMPFLMSSQEAADIIIRGIERRKREIAFPRRLIWPLSLMSILPSGVRHSIGLRMVRNQAV